MDVDKNNQVFMVTSTVDSEEKSLTSCNLAVVLAENNDKVLLIDADLRKPKLHKIMGLERLPGVTGIVFEEKELNSVVQQIKDVKNLDILTAGDALLKPTEILGSQHFKTIMEEARASYDVIVIDVPSVLSVSDAMIISQMSDGVLFVVTRKSTSRSDSKYAKKLLDNVGANILGVILTHTSKAASETGYH